MLFSYLYVCSFVFCNCSYAALSSTMLFPCAGVCGSAHVFYMNFTIWSVDVSLFCISCDVYSLKSLCDLLYNNKMLLKLYVYMFFFVFCNCSHAVLPSIFEFLISYCRTVGCFHARAWVLHFQGCARDPLCMNFTISSIWSMDDSLFCILCYAYSRKSLSNLYVQWQKYCFIVCMRVLVWISHLINWWLHV